MIYALVGITALLILSNLWWYIRLFHPLRLLVLQAKQLSEGDFDALTRHGRHSASEVVRLQTAMAAMVGHVRRAQSQERAYIEVLMNGQEAERTRIARELHDDTTQSLIAIAQRLEMAESRIVGDAQASIMLRFARQQAVETVNNLRRLIADLRPPMLEELGLVPALQMLSEGLCDASITVDTLGVARRLNSSLELALFRCAQEAIQNACRHSQATHVTLELHFDEGSVELKIRDDGKGFAVPLSPHLLAEEGHYGLLGMAERVEQLHGHLQITSLPVIGTEIELRIPIAGTIQPDDVVRDPVCSAPIQPHQAYSSLLYEDQRYYFCCPVCQGAFQQSPLSYLKPTSTRH